MRDYSIKGYTWFADIYCYGCGHTLPDIDPEGNDKHAVFTWDEYDGHDDNGDKIGGSCGKCGGGIK